MDRPDRALFRRLRRRATDARAAATILGDARTAPVRTLAYRDGRRAVRLAFLAGAATNRYLEHLPATPADLADTVGAKQRARLDAWLRIGQELGELSDVDGVLLVSGRRARAIARNDPIVTPFYRSVAEYYFGPHLDLPDLAGDHPGRDDLSRSATTIADVSRVTEPLLAGALLEIIRSVTPSSWLEIGCGSGVHLETALRAAPEMRAVAVDLDHAVIADATTRFQAAGLADRVSFRVGDALEVVRPDEQFEVVTLLNNIYYFPEDDRARLLGKITDRLLPGGELVVASQCAADDGERGSIAAAQLDFLLRVQREADASLPTMSQLEAVVAQAPGIGFVDVWRPLPGEPYLLVRGTKR